MTASDTARRRVAVATHDPIAAWQARVVEALADVPGVELVEWSALPRPAGARIARSGEAALAAAATADRPPPNRPARTRGSSSRC